MRSIKQTKTASFDAHSHTSLPNSPRSSGIESECVSDTHSPAMEQTTEEEEKEKEKEMDDRLSELPEHVLLHILSFLPNKIAAQTSLLSRLFRRLWESSPVLDLDFNACVCEGLLSCRLFIDLANRTILHRDPPSPLPRLRINLPLSISFEDRLGTPYISSLLLKASSLGLRHLTVCLGRGTMLTVLSPLIFSISSLQSLSLFYPTHSDTPFHFLSAYNRPITVPSFPITLVHLKSLSIVMSDNTHHLLNDITSHLKALQDLHLDLTYISSSCFYLQSATIKRLNLVLSCRNLLKISTPSLELFELDSVLLDSLQWEMPLLKKAIIRWKFLFRNNVPPTCEILKAVAHVEELHLDIKERVREEHLHALLVPGVELPTLFKLKHFNLEVCFHEHNIEDLVTLLEHFPALESLKLVHKPPKCYSQDENTKMELWRSKLPGNAEGDCTSVNFKDLNIYENRRELINQLTRKQFSKKLKT